MLGYAGQFDAEQFDKTHGWWRSSPDQSGTKIIKRKNINIGMAAALPTGNLIVPVIKNADQKKDSKEER